jgi:hypothetical protein
MFKKTTSEDRGYGEGKIRLWKELQMLLSSE